MEPELWREQTLTSDTVLGAGHKYMYLNMQTVKGTRPIERLGKSHRA